ncbi:hypothetical protein GALMADRAFT_218548 [Galerina marginata CBS 339.88]|uniref:WHIM1 domain-containing protein n=1 Tax=Galerina marginata (strain CBS 339.88) TaxID=685588 RepID=A0A067TT42_GALM3|nr:hypothetical protein GALMADRAFT_218548 [Galerina marginata CBS 339.88]
MATYPSLDKKPHQCPPSNATHPSGRWESLFVYSFICKFTNLRHKVEGLESPMDLEEALMLKEPNNIVTQLLVQFVVNLKPQTRNLSTDQISTTVASVLSEYFKSSERTIFWDEDLKVNVDPFEGLEGGFFATDWDFKLKILRQLVELQLCHAPEIKATIDNAWGVVHNKHKKNHAPVAPLEANDPKSQERLLLQPIGQDCHRKRFWVADDSPRLYMSTNPWKMTATVQAIASTREEYLAAIESLKASAASEPKKGRKRTKFENGHIALIAALEARIEAIDVELTRVQRVRKKIEQKRLLLAQAEVRQTRTRRQTQKPDYVYGNDIDSEDDGDEYRYQEEDRQDDEYEQEHLNGTRRGRAGPTVGTRRSARTSTVNSNGKRDGSSDSGLWRGERRSSRLGGVDSFLEVVEPPRKRARTEESSVSAQSTDGVTTETHGVANGVRVKTSGAAALKPTEIAMEQIAGKKRSKFWVYAVEPIPGPRPSAPDPPNVATTSSDMNGHKTNGHANHTEDSPDANGHSTAMDYTNGLEGSLSPINSP